MARVHFCLNSNSLDEQTNQLMRAFWEVKEIPADISTLSADSYSAMEQFTSSREHTGRYVVRLPRRDPAPPLSCSRDHAARRFRCSLSKKGQWSKFQGAVQEYADLNHAELVPSEDLVMAEAETYYLPMHGVTKETSTTTKLRVVFDAPAKTSSGYSLNDLLLPGPSLYPLLTTTLFKFRRQQVRMSSDISKMFREVGLHPADRDLHLYLTYSRDSDQLQDWRMTRVTFSVASSPFLATQVLHTLAEDYQEEHPRAAAIIQNTFYVDDCLTGTDSLSRTTSRPQCLAFQGLHAAKEVVA